MSGGLWRDVRFALRFMLRRPGFTGVVVFSLAIAVGANTAIFSIVNAVLLGTLPIHEPDGVVGVYTLDEKNPGHLPISDLNARDVRVRPAEHLGIAMLAQNVGVHGDRRDLEMGAEHARPDRLARVFG